MPKSLLLIITSDQYVKTNNSIRINNSGLPLAHCIPHKPSDKQDKLKHKRSSFRRFSAVLLTEVSMTDIAMINQVHYIISNTPFKVGLIYILNLRETVLLVKLFSKNFNG